MMLDSHTHRSDAADALVSVSPTDFAPAPGRLYAVGIHPWRTQCGDVAEQLRALDAVARHCQVAAIGETGLDSLRGAPLDEQMGVFSHHIRLAEALGKPLVIHMVRTSQQVLKAWRGSGRCVPWAIHGFRGNVGVAKPLVEAGFYISFGERFNADALRTVPPDRLLAETDESQMPIVQVVSRMAAALAVQEGNLQRILADNLCRFFKL